MRKSLFGLLLLISVQYTATSQAYPLGLNPNSLKWKTIETDKVQVIYPEGINDQAMRVASIVENIYDSSYYSLGPKNKKVSIILQNQSINPNGFVTVGPFRSEFYTNAPQYNFGGTVDWLDMLAVHEYRHVQQLVNAQRGISKLGKWLYGEYGWSVIAHTALPPWYFEGDAVFFETNLTNAGRGRQPAFEGEYRAILLTDTKLKYEKNSAGSFKDYIPNIYNMGYHLSSAIQREYGEVAFSKIAEDAVRFNGLIYPFSRSLKKTTGLRTPKFHRQTFEQLTSDWQAKLESLDMTNSTDITAPTKTFTNYRNTRWIDNETFVVDKSAFNQIPKYKLMNLEGEEKNLTVPGIYSRHNATLSTDGRDLYWTENQFDERWGNQEYSVITRMNLETKDKEYITSKTRYFAPAISKDGRKLVAIHSPANGYTELHVLNAVNGDIINEIPNAQGMQYSFPVWVSENEIAVVTRSHGLNSILKVDATSGRTTEIVSRSDQQYAYLETDGSFIYFNSTIGGIDNIFAASIDGGSVYQVTSTKFGATQPAISPDGQKLVFSEYSKKGYSLKAIEIDRQNWKETKVDAPSLIDYYEPVAKRDILSSLPPGTYEEEDYTRTDAPKLHSWSPFYFHPNLGIQVHADNKMSTISATGRYNYNLNENRSSYSASVRYAQLYPVISANYQFAKRSRYVPIYFEEEEDGEPVPDVGIAGQTWNEHDLYAGITLPFNLTRASFYNQVWLTNNIHQIWVDYANPDTGTDGLFVAYELDLYMSFTQRQAYQHLNPRWGMDLRMNYNKTLGVEKNDSYQFHVNSTFYLPGIGANHSLYTQLDYQAEPFTAQYKFSDNFQYARGYGSSLTYDNIYRIGVNYSLPLFYPDVALGPLMFIKRAKVNFFYDYSVASTNKTSVDDLTPLTRVSFDGLFLPNNSETQRSAGAELTFDLRVLRGFDVDMGVRYSYLLDESRSTFQPLVLSIGF